MYIYIYIERERWRHMLKYGMVRLVEYMLQPLTHKIKRASARSSHMCLLPYFSHPFTHDLDSRGYRGWLFTFDVLSITKQMLFKSCKTDSFHRMMLYDMI